MLLHKFALDQEQIEKESQWFEQMTLVYMESGHQAMCSCIIILIR